MIGNFVEELQWRGMLHDITPGAEEVLREQHVKAYIGFDPTADSLHIGNLVQIIILMHLQRCGHTPIALIGGATGMIGDPSGKSQERNLLDEETLHHNEASIKTQLARFLNFDTATENAALLVNNYDWMNGIRFIDFARDIGKHISVNYMMAKDSVKKRLSGETSDGMSFTEFTYQLVQGYDFLHLHDTYDCSLQLGGSDQWGNITTGMELIRRKSGGKAYALTCPLITKADGTKFGKSEGGNVWLSAARTSAYKFYQYWLNTSDEDAERYIKIFTFLSKKEIENLIAEHHKTPHLRLLQKKIAAEVTTIVHSAKDTSNAIKASGILFGKATSEDLKALDVQTFLDVFEGVPQAEISHADLEAEIPMIELLVAKTGFLASNGEARRALKENSISINREKVGEADTISPSNLLNDTFILLQRGKKNYFLVTVV